MKRGIKTLSVLAVVAVAATACGNGGSGTTSGPKTVEIGVDLPFQGSSADASTDTLDAMQLYLDQIGGKVGDITVTLKKYDDSTAAKGSWDDATCKSNANDHVANTDEIAVMGTYNSGCAKLEAPVLNQATDGPMLMISHANTATGLTQPFDTGEPDKYFPTGTRNFGRVVTRDDVQGPADAQFAINTLGVKKIFVIDDTQTYGVGVAKSFGDEAAKHAGVEVKTGEWDINAGASNVALFQQAKDWGADAVFLGGIFDNNGGQLVKDKVQVLGDNTAVKLLAPDGFTGYTDFLNLPESTGTYLSFAGLSTGPLKAAGGVPAQFIADFATKYGYEPRTSYALYGVQALQVILAALEASDGTRKGVDAAVFTAPGIDIAADKAILGKEIKIDPASGDVNAEDISIEIVNANPAHASDSTQTLNEEDFLQPQAVE